MFALLLAIGATSTVAYELPQSSLEIHVYADFGAFVPFGDGSGVVLDTGREVTGDRFSEFGWVFLGDLHSPAVNGRGEPADLGELPGVDRFDSVNSRGAAGFILNEVNLSMSVTPAPWASMRTSINFVPRTGSDFAFGDFFDLDIAQLELYALDDPNLTFYVGKIESVFGSEYRERRSRNRIGVTPSLAARYTSGTNLGVKAKAVLLSGWVLAAVSFTNGTSTTEAFHFADEIDSNDGKTVAGRLALRVPLLELTDVAVPGTLEIGVSGQWGPQDRSTSGDGAFWLAGVDLRYDSVSLLVRGQWMMGAAPGDAVDRAFSLELDTAGYIEVAYLFLPWVGGLVRGGIRDAVVTLTTDRVYLTKSWRLTLGLWFPISEFLTVKAEFLKNGEYGVVPEIDNDILTSSLIVYY